MNLRPLRHLSTSQLQALADEVLLNGEFFLELLAQTPATRPGAVRSIKASIRRNRREAAFILRLLNRRSKGFNPGIRWLEIRSEALGKGFEKAVAPPPSNLIAWNWDFRGTPA